MKKHANESIHNEIKKSGLKYWQVADLLNIAPETLSKHLRHEMRQEEKQRIIEVIKEGSK